MLTSTIISWLAKIFTTVKQTTYGSELDQFITSKHPQSVHDVEYWTMRYERDNLKGWKIL